MAMKQRRILTDDEIQKRLLYRDGLILILDKPAGLPVHKGPKGGPCLEDSFDALRFGLPKAPALAHRLDADTSGCLVLGRHAKALRKLGKLFSSAEVMKTYWAVLQGKMPMPQGVIDAPLIKRSSKQKGWWMEVAQDGQKAITHYQVLGEGEGLSWVEFKPKTGRTHQIRIHAAHLECPILGDPIYGPGDSRPMHLHARRIQFKLQASKPALDIRADIPNHMRDALKICGFKN